MDDVEEIAGEFGALNIESGAFKLVHTRTLMHSHKSPQIPSNGRIRVGFVSESRTMTSGGIVPNRLARL